MNNKFATFIILLFNQLVFAQLGSDCGIPSWNTTRGYPTNSYVIHNDIVYNNTIWSQNEEPNAAHTNWITIGSCNEQLIVDYPELAYTNCGNLNEWDSELANYFENDLLLFSNGVYRAKYWVAGTEQPDLSDAYEFLGICIVPIEIIPSFSNQDVIIQSSSLEAVSIEAIIDTNGFTVLENKIRIKKSTEQNFDEFDMSLSDYTLSYNWNPSEYGDYDLQYYCKNAVGVETLENRAIKIAKSNPPQISVTAPEASSSYYQLNFSSISITFEASPTEQPIQTLIFKDITANTAHNIQVSTTNTYSFDWTPTAYGKNELAIVAEDALGTENTTGFSYTIIDPTIENISFDQLPYQIKSVHGIQKEFVFDKTITSVKSRNLPLTNFSLNGNIFTVNSDNPGRTGLELTTSDGTRYHIGLRIDNEDGSIPQFPEHISIGSVSEDIPDDVNFFNNGINNENLLLNNRMDVRYTYVNGGPLIGWNTWQPDRVIKFAKNSLKMGLIPFFIFYNIPDGGESYTTNLEHIQNPDYMTAYFENLDLFLNQVKEQVGDEFFGVIFEPDFLGYMQQNSEPPTLATSVGETTIGLNHGTLKTLVERINFEINKKREEENLNLKFGWQLNLWAKPNVSGIRGIIRETDNETGVGGGDFETQLQKIRQTAIDVYKYGETMGIMSSNADFISIDKYGLDALGYSNQSHPEDPSSYTWFWNNDHWLNYYEFVKALYLESGVHVILWQITVGHINGSTTINAYTGTNFRTLQNTSKYYEDSASPFFFGDTVDFFNDQARFDYFSENKHNDPKLISNPNTKHVTFGNHFDNLNAIGVRLVLMGAGVGDSTDGIGDPTEPGATLTDDHFWIQKVQDYYMNHLVLSTLGLSEEMTLDHSETLFFVKLLDRRLVIKNLSKESSTIDVFVFDLQGKLVVNEKNQLLKKHSELQLSTPKLGLGIYICLIKNQNKISSFKIIHK